MRFHLGVSMNIKKLLKYILPILVGIACYFGIFQIQVLADTQGYYEIDGTTDIQCNIFMGNTTTNNIIHNQVTSNFNYNDTTITLNQIQNGITQGWKSSNIYVRYKRSSTQTLHLSFKITNNDFINACTSWPSSVPSADRTASNCSNPVVRVYYCQDDTFNINDTSSCKYNDLNNYSNRSVLNSTLRSNSWLNNYYNTDSSTTWDYIQITFPNMTNTSSGVPTLNTGWEYYDVYFGDTSFDETSAMLSNYCTNTGAPNESGNVNSSVTDAINDAITETLTGPNGVLLDTTVPNISIPFFQDLVFNSTSVQAILTFPIDMLYVITQNQGTCTPYTINLSNFTQRFGHFNYTLTLPCIRDQMQTLLGNWYEVFDLMIAGILFYYFSSNLILKINDILSGADTMPYFYVSSSKYRTTRPILADIQGGYTLKNGT